ncbi:hypothetical protein [Chryseobacterium sp.]|uniref:hypothetical protein n=1 Tax=Chryseobacterium sp. TaxID=1871047 RepID=UPI0035B37BAA
MDTTNIKNKINLNIKDNQAREITAEKVREVLHFMTDDINTAKADKTEVEQSIANQEQRLQTHINNQANPHNTNKSQIGLGNVDNTSDTNKPVSTATQVALGNKVDKTTTSITAPDATFKYAYIFDDNNSVRRMLAGDLGKNVANSALTSVVNAGLTLGANWTVNTSGFYYSITGLSDVSNDATFNTLLTQNSAGRVAKSNGKAAFTALPSLLTEAEKNTWKTAMNGGWSTGTMSVAIISPPIVDSTDKPYWINLKGVNLNLPPTSFKVELCTGDSASAATVTVVAEIPGSQVQLYTNGIDLTFYYNFKNLPVGQYKIRLWNGLVWYLTSFTISVVTQVMSVDLNNITWSRKIYNNTTSPVITESGSTVSYNSDPNVKAMADDSSFVAARKTNELVGADEDFYMTVEITGSTSTVTNANGSMTHLVGLVNSASTVDLLNQTVVNVRAQQRYWYPFTIFFPDNSPNSLSHNIPSPFGLSVIFMRRGGSWTIIITYNNQTLLYTKTGYTGAIAFGMYNQNTVAATGISANIVELYKF